MSEYYTGADQWGQDDANTDIDTDIDAETPPQAEPPVSRRPRRTSSRRSRSSAVTRAAAEAVLDRYETMSTASETEREALKTVLGSSATDIRSLTVALASGVEPKHAAAMDDLLTIAASDDADRDMVALTLGVGQSGMKRLRAAWQLAGSPSKQTQNLSTNPVQAARSLAQAASDVFDVLSTVKTLLG